MRVGGDIFGTFDCQRLNPCERLSRRLQRAWKWVLPWAAPGILLGSCCFLAIPLGTVGDEPRPESARRAGRCAGLAGGRSREGRGRRGEDGDVIAPQHPAQVVRDLPESLLGAPTGSFPEVSLSIVNRKKNKNKPKTTNSQISCSQISGRKEEKMLFVLVYALPNLPLSSFTQEFT